MRKSLNIKAIPEESISDVFRRNFHIALAHDGLCNKDIAEKMSMLPPVFSNKINGSRISLQFACKVAKTLDLSLDWLCGLDDE